MMAQFDFCQSPQYWLDAWQRQILFLDLLRQRGNIYREHNASQVPHVLDYQADLVLDGRTLPRPVNYLLVRIVPPQGTRTDPANVPFIVVDPRAGHGPGIGGMKQESEIGVALKAGHPCYFVGFLPTPVEGQTIEDVCRAEAVFVERVASLHPQAEGKPVIIANCQAGWQIMMMAATRPELTGPILLAGSPLSYWAGVRGRNPLRYLGGVLGGTWMTALAGDLGHGIFDGAHLIANFESMNPANTYWQKAYNVYSKVDTEGGRFLDFETWWGSPVLLNAGEMQWIADNLFVGNKLSAGEIRTSEGIRVDLRNIRSPIIVLCSWGDDITPPQQALGWITDLYNHESEIVLGGQTIIYTLHQSIGHLGIFVSGKVASREHGEFASCMDMIAVMLPGLYEAVITEVAPDTANPELIEGRYLFRLEARTLDDIRALGGNNPEDEKRFATAARVSEVTQGLYQTLASPTVRALATAPVAEAIRKTHPNRMLFSLFSDENPMMWPVKAMADTISAARQPAEAHNLWLAMEKSMSSWIVSSLDCYATARDILTETLFLNLYGSPLVQAMVGLGPQVPPTRHHIERDLAREATAARTRSELERKFETGGIPQALLRAMIYVRLPERSVDERGFAMLKAIHASQPTANRLTLRQVKETLRDQFLLVLLDPQRAIKAIPRLLPRKAEERRPVLEALRLIVTATGEMPEDCRQRLSEVEALFDLPPDAPAKRDTVHA